MTRLADTRRMTLDDARGVFEDLARAQILIWKRQAAFDDKVAALKSRLEEETAEARAAVAAGAAALRDFILAHKELFQKPRKVKTPFGTFGLETECELQVLDENALIEAILDRGYDDCVKTERSVLKKPVAARIDAGETFPGCKVLEGDVAKYKVDRSLADEVELTDAGRAATTAAAEQ
jgi:phage host-nuclease inhibitor protein Gam